MRDNSSTHHKYTHSDESEFTQYYGFTESIDYIEDGVRIVFDSFPLLWQRKLDEIHTSNYEFISNLPTHIIEIDIPRGKIDKIHGLQGRKLAVDRWYRLSTGPEGISGRVYSSPLEDGRAEKFTAIEHLDGRKKEASSLYRIFSLDYFDFTNEDEIKGILKEGLSGAGAFVAVYNVGQGNCNAICNKQSEPLVYYDFGGGCLQHKSKYLQGQKYCFTHNPPIILSHWDMDHWVAAEYYPEAKKHMWLVPQQQMGPTHLKFAADLRRNNCLKVWPSGLPFVALPFGTIVKCTGRKRNDSGLALVVDATELNCGKGLLPGDAAYRYIPASYFADLDYLVAAHHGAFVPRDRYPQSSSSNGALALSYGMHNCYGHPDHRARRKYSLAGWYHQIHTTGGHTALGWSSSVLPQLKCKGSQCDLKIVQV